MEYDSKKPLTYTYEHQTRCLDTLRRDILCNADDTPRYQTPTKTPDSGVGQMRMCRDWDKLEAWAKQYNSCWNYVDEAHDHQNELERYIYCPPESPYFARSQRWAQKHGVKKQTS